MCVIRRAAGCIAALLLACVFRPAAADPALWIARAPTATVYLFGTIHILPQADSGAWLGPALQRALAASTELWTEADISDLRASVGAIRRYGLYPAHSTASLLPPDYRARFLRQIAQTQVPAALVAQARPWLAEILLNGAAMQHAGPVTLGAESTLLAYARAHHMMRATFETLDQQFAMLADMPESAQLASLEQQIDEFDQTGPIFARLLSAWGAGDEAALDKLTNGDMRARDPHVWTELILRRNERFAQKIGERLQGSGTAFVAVGAAHLCGLTGVPALLQREGYTVTRLQ